MEIEAAEEYIKSQHMPAISWHATLNNHSSTRPEQYGGTLVNSVTECETFEQLEPGSASSRWRCVLEMPNSFAPNDGRVLRVESVAGSRSAASAIACFRMMARLLHEDPSQVVLRPVHWNVSVKDLLAGLPGRAPGSAGAPH